MFIVIGYKMCFDGKTYFFVIKLLCSNKSHIIYTVACKITKFYNDFGNIINEISRAGLCGMGSFWISSSTPHHSLFVDVSSMILFLMLHWWDVGCDENRQLNFPTNKWPWHFFTNRNWHAAFEAKKKHIYNV